MPTIFADRFFRYIAIFVLFIALLNRLQGLGVLAFSILAFIYGAKIWSRAGIYKTFLKFQAEDSRIFPGETFSLSVNVENRKLLPIWLQIVFQPLETSFPELGEIKESSLLWFQKVGWKLKITAAGRGWYLLDAPSLFIGDPFGFFQERKKTTTDPVELIVYPEVFPVNLPPLPRKTIMGDITDRNGMVKDPVFFSGIREYQYGRPAKYISWNASARYHTLQEKIFDSSTELKVLFLIDVQEFKEDKVRFEKMLEVAASMALQLDQEGFSFGLITNGYLAGKIEKESGFLPVRRNGDHLAVFLELLARLKQKSCYRLEDLLERERGIPRGTTALHFTYSRDGKVFSVEEVLKEKRASVVNIFCCPVEKTYRRTGEFYWLEDFLPASDRLKLADKTDEIHEKRRVM